MIDYFVSKGVPIDTVILTAIAIAFEIYVLCLCRRDIIKWVKGVTYTVVRTLALRPKRRRSTRKNPASPANK